MEPFRSLLSRLAAIAVISLIMLPVSASAHFPVNAKNNLSLAPMLKKTTPAVVNIVVKKMVLAASDGSASGGNDQSSRLSLKKVMGVGSGIIINAEKGYIVTNAHVVKDQKFMMVNLKDGRRYHAKLIGQDEGFDLAVIQIHAKHLKTMSFASSDRLNVGDFVVAIGSPYGLSQTVTSGVVSALNRQVPMPHGMQRFIQTDAPINLGNSGGALINAKGQLVGMNTAIVTPSRGNIGIGFAIPSNIVKSVASQLIRYGKVTRGVLGVLAQDMTPALAKALAVTGMQGPVVTKVVPHTPAASAGIKVQDIIKSVNGTPIRCSGQLHNMLQLMRPRTKMVIEVMRAHRLRILHVVVADLQHFKQPNAIPFLSGVRLQQLSDLEPDGRELHGVLVISLSDDSDAAIGGLQPGDVILSANNKKTPDIRRLLTAIAQNEDRVLLKIARGPEVLFVVINHS